jgi:hypothetical protein
VTVDRPVSRSARAAFAAAARSAIAGTVLTEPTAPASTTGDEDPVSECIASLAQI